jgi:hypothetical protein
MVPREQFGERLLVATARRIHKLLIRQMHKSLKHDASFGSFHKLIILNVTSE